MLKKQTIQALILGLVILGLTACGGARTSNTPTPDAQAIYTQAAQAAQAEATQIAALTPSATPQPSPTATSPVTPTPAVTMTVATTATPAAPTATATSLAGASSEDQATLVSQSPANNATVGLGETFKVTWTLKNSGQSTWTTSYALKWYSGMQGQNLTLANTAFLTGAVAPDATTDVAITFTAPSTVGAAQTTWYLQNTLTGANIMKVTLSVQVANVPTATATAVTATTAPTTAATATTAPTATAITPTITPTK